MGNNGKSEKGKGMGKDNKAVKESRIKYFILKHPLLSAFIISFLLFLHFLFFILVIAKKKELLTFH